MICVWLSSPDDQLVQRGGGGGGREREIYIFLQQSLTICIMFFPVFLKHSIVVEVALYAHARLRTIRRRHDGLSFRSVRFTSDCD